jgi:hypothetical protein
MSPGDGDQAGDVRLGMAIEKLAVGDGEGVAYRASSSATGAAPGRGNGSAIHPPASPPRWRTTLATCSSSGARSNMARYSWALIGSVLPPMATRLGGRRPWDPDRPVEGVVVHLVGDEQRPANIPQEKPTGTGIVIDSIICSDLPPPRNGSEIDAR